MLAPVSVICIWALKETYMAHIPNLHIGVPVLPAGLLGLLATGRVPYRDDVFVVHSPASAALVNSHEPELAWRSSREQHY